MNKKILFALIGAPLLLANDGGCSGADAEMARDTDQMASEANKQVPLPRVTNWTEKKLVRDIYERRDRANLSTYAYTQGIDGRLHCLGKALGYGVPYSAQFSNPQRYHANGATLPQPEPNGLFVPDGMIATWLQLVNPASGKVEVVYVEPTITVSPFRLSGPIVATDC